MILTPAARAGGINLSAELFTAVRSGNMEQYLLLVPTNRRARVLTRELLNAAPLGLSSLNTGTIVSLFTALHGSVKPGIKRLSDAAAALLVKKGLQRLRAGYFKGYSAGAPQGTINKITRVFREFKRAGVTPELIAGEWGEDSANARAKAAALAELYDTYLTDCLRQNFAEPGDDYRALLAQPPAVLQEAFQKAYPRVSHVFLFGYSEFTAPEAELLNRIAVAVQGELYIELDYYAPNNALFGILQASVDLLAKHGFSEIPDLSLAADSRWAAFLKAALFSELPAKYSGDTSAIKIVTTATRSAEAAFIADTCKTLLLEGKARPDEIAVVFNLISDYSPLIRDSFSIRGIPLNLTDRYYAASVQSAIAVLKLLEVAENDWFFKDVLRTFSEPLLPFAGVPLAALQNLASGKRLLRGKNYWFTIINQALTAAIDEADDRAHNQLTRVHKALETLDGWLRPLYGKITPRQFLEGVTSVIAGSGINLRVTALPREVLEINIRGLHTFLETAKEVTAIITMENPDTTEYLQYYLNQVRTALQVARVNTTEKPGFGVSVTTPDELRGLSFKYLFIGGLYEGNLPSRFQPEVFHPDAFSEQERKHRGREQYLYYQALRSWQKGLWLTAPLQEEKSELQPSAFIAELSRGTGILPQPAPPAPVYSTPALLATAGAELRAGTSGNALHALGQERRLAVLKSVEVDFSRRQAQATPGPYAGMISGQLPEPILEKLTQMRDRLFSISQLELYAKCPFRYFAERVLYLTEIKDPTEDVDALEMGTVLHSVVEKFYNELLRLDIDLRTAGNEQRKQAYELLFAIAQKEIDALGLPEFIIFWEREKLLGVNGNHEQSLLQMFWDRELLETAFAPRVLEAAFGDPALDPGKPITELQYNGIRLRGKIDRVDLTTDESLFRIVDYKRGKGVPQKQDIEEGLALQLPVYLFAGSQLLQQQYGLAPNPVEPVIYSFNFSNEHFGPHRVLMEGAKPIAGAHLTAGDAATLSANAHKVMEAGLAKLNAYVDGITAGQFPLSTLKSREHRVCAYCHLTAVCRVQDTE